MKRKLFDYIGAKEQKGIPFAYIIEGEGCTVTYKEKYQGGEEWQQILFTMTVTQPHRIDISTRVISTHNDFPNQEQLVNYVLMLMENHEFEEIYNACLYIEKVRFEAHIAAFKKKKNIELKMDTGDIHIVQVLSLIFKVVLLIKKYWLQ
jgi:hypothetical protein